MASELLDGASLSSKKNPVIVQPRMKNSTRVSNSGGQSCCMENQCMPILAIYDMLIKTTLIIGWSELCTRCSSL